MRLTILFSGYRRPFAWYAADDMDDATVDAKRAEVARRMSALGGRLESGDDSELMVWVIPNALACAHLHSTPPAVRARPACRTVVLGEAGSKAEHPVLSKSPM